MKYLLLTSILTLLSCTGEQVSNIDSENNIESTYKRKSKINLNNGYLVNSFTTHNYLGNNPHGASRSYVDGVQGLANDGANWFLSNKKKIYKWNGSYGFPNTLPSGSDQVGQVSNSIVSKNYDHYGDLDYDEDQNLLYVPVEYKNKTNPPILMVFNSTLDYVDHKIMHNSQNDTKEAPWVSIDPITKEIYTSKFRNVNELWVYKDSINYDSLSISYERSVQLKKQDGSQLTLHEVQGGEFSKSGHLFLLAEGGPNGEGIYTFDCTTTTASCKFLNYEFMELDQGYGQEFEGITIWDLDNTSGNGGFGGQIHAITWQPFKFGVGYKKFWLKHFRYGYQSTEVITPKITGTTINNKPHLEWDDFGLGYLYEVYEENMAPNGGLSLVTTTSSNNITINKPLENDNINGVNYPIFYFIKAKINNVKSKRSNEIQYLYEYDNSGSNCLIPPCPTQF